MQLHFHVLNRVSGQVSPVDVPTVGGVFAFASPKAITQDFAQAWAELAVAMGEQASHPKPPSPPASADEDEGATERSDAEHKSTQSEVVEGAIPLTTPTQNALSPFLLLSQPGESESGCNASGKSQWPPFEPLPTSEVTLQLVEQVPPSPPLKPAPNPPPFWPLGSVPEPRLAPPDQAIEDTSSQARSAEFESETQESAEDPPGAAVSPSNSQHWVAVGFAGPALGAEQRFVGDWHPTAVRPAEPDPRTADPAKPSVGTAPDTGQGAKGSDVVFNLGTDFSPEPRLVDAISSAASDDRSRVDAAQAPASTSRREADPLVVISTEPESKFPSTEVDQPLHPKGNASPQTDPPHMAGPAMGGGTSVKAAVPETPLGAAAPLGSAWQPDEATLSRQIDPEKSATSASRSVPPEIGKETVVPAEMPQRAETEISNLEAARAAPQVDDPAEFINSVEQIFAAAADELPIVMPPQERIWRSVWSVTRGEIGWLHDKMRPLNDASLPQPVKHVEQRPIELGGPTMQSHFTDDKLTNPKGEPLKAEQNEGLSSALAARGGLPIAFSSPPPPPQPQGHAIIEAIIPLPVGLEALGATSGADLHKLPAIHPPAAETARPTPPSLPTQIISTLTEASGPITEVRLRPEELGHLRIEMHQEGDRFVMTFSAERPETLDLLRRHSSELAQDLRNAGHGALDLNFGPWARQEENGAAFGPEGTETMEGKLVEDRRIRQRDSALANTTAAPGGLYLRI